MYRTRCANGVWHRLHRWRNDDSNYDPNFSCVCSNWILPSICPAFDRSSHSIFSPNNRRTANGWQSDSVCFLVGPKTIDVDSNSKKSLRRRDSVRRSHLLLSNWLRCAQLNAAILLSSIRTMNCRRAKMFLPTMTQLNWFWVARAMFPGRSPMWSVYDSDYERLKIEIQINCFPSSEAETDWTHLANWTALKCHFDRLSLLALSWNHH